MSSAATVVPSSSPQPLTGNGLTPEGKATVNAIGSVVGIYFRIPFLIIWSILAYYVKNKVMKWIFAIFAAITLYGIIADIMYLRSIGRKASFTRYM